MKKILTIAGSDSSCGAGIQADIKTISSLGGYGLSVITALTAQNSYGVKKVQAVDSICVKRQLEAIFDDIKIDAIKIGMVCNKEIIYAIIEYIKQFKNIPVVLDTIISSSSGYRLLDEGAMEVFVNELMPICTIATPNIPEAEMLTNSKIDSISDMENRIKNIKAKNVLLKGGHLKGGEAVDILLKNGNEMVHFFQKRVAKDDVHGTGCTLSSAIAYFLSKEYSLDKAVKLSKDYITEAIKHSFKIGNKTLYLNHFYGRV